MKRRKKYLKEVLLGKHIIKPNTTQRRAIIALYKEGWNLIELERSLGADSFIICKLLKKRRFTRKELHKIYEKQESRRERIKKIEYLENETNSIDKYFPTETSEFTYRYYLYWDEKHKKAEAKKAKCQHKVKHVRCSICNKILTDVK